MPMRMTSSVLVISVTAAIFSASSCVKSTLNNPCQLKFADGGAIPESFAKELTLKDKDFISVGAVDCDSLFCVRDSAFVNTSPLLPDGGQDAFGYCTEECLKPGDVCSTGVPDDDREGATKQLKCRSLLLNEELLANPEVRKSLPGITTSLFCARTVDAGT